MRDEDVHIGDTVRVRQWDDMKNEFGTDQNGNINCIRPITPRHAELKKPW